MISKDEVQGLAELARLQLKDSEVESLQKDISNILEYVGQVSNISVSAQKESPVNRNVMREDTPRTKGHLMQNKEEALKAAFPKQEGGYNVVRKIIQKDE